LSKPRPCQTEAPPDQPKHCHFDRTPSGVEGGSGETRFSTPTASSRKHPSLPVPQNLSPTTKPGAPLMQSHRMSAPSHKAQSAFLTQPKPRLPTHHPVISTEATDSLTVCCAVEKPPHFAFVLAFVLPNRQGTHSHSLTACIGGAPLFSSLTAIECPIAQSAIRLPHPTQTPSPNPRPRHFDRSNRQSHRLLRSGETPAFRFCSCLHSSKPPGYPFPRPHTLPDAPLMQSHRMSAPSHKAQSAFLTQPKPRLPTHHPVISTGAQRSGETRFSIQTPSPRKQPSLPHH
jgi:hypothetical protein